MPDEPVTAEFHVEDQPDPADLDVLETQILVVGEHRERDHDRERQEPAEAERGAVPHTALGREDKDERGSDRFECDHQANENEVEDDHARPDLPALRSAFTRARA